jgi:hypothetical protein
MSKVTITYKEPKVIEFDDITSAQDFIKDKNEKDITIVVPATDNVYDII